MYVYTLTKIQRHGGSFLFCKVPLPVFFLFMPAAILLAKSQQPQSANQPWTRQYKASLLFRHIPEKDLASSGSSIVALLVPRPMKRLCGLITQSFHIYIYKAINHHPKWPKILVSYDKEMKIFAAVVKI